MKVTSVELDSSGSRAQGSYGGSDWDSVVVYATPAVAVGGG